MYGTIDLRKFPKIISIFERILNFKMAPAKTKLSTKVGNLSAISLTIIVPKETPTK